MVLDECHFVYNGITSSDYKLVFAHVDTSEATEMFTEGEVTTVYNRRNHSHYLTDKQWMDNPFELEVEIVTEDGTPLKKADRRACERAWFNTKNWGNLYIIIADDPNGYTWERIDGEVKKTYFKCQFREPTKIFNGNDQIIGWKVKIVCDSFLLYQQELEHTFTFENIGATNGTYPTRKFTVTLDTDLGDYTYPRVELTLGSIGGTVKIANTTDSSTRYTTLTELPAGTVVTMDGNLNWVSGNYYEKFTGANFLRLLDGANSISFWGNVTKVVVRYNNRKFLDS